MLMAAYWLPLVNLQMKIKMRLLIVLTVLIFSCRQEFKELTVDQAEYGVAEISIDQLESNGIKLKEGELVLFFSDNPNHPLVSQPIRNSEGALESFMVKVGAERTVTTEIVLADHYPEFKAHTNIRLAAKKPELHEVSTYERLKGFDTNVTSPVLQMEGPAWENEFVAFRNYLDERNGMDIFGKKIDTMVLDEVGVPGGPSYHNLQDWGQDILKVGNSLGAGSIALQIGDSLYRIGPDATSFTNIVTEGPLKSVLEFTFDNWEVQGRSYQVRHQVEIQSGTRFYQSFVSVKGLKGDERLVTGIVNMNSDSLYSYKGVQEVAFGTYDNQAFGGEKLGMAIAVNKDDFNETFTTPDTGKGITQTYGLTLNLYKDRPTSFRFYSCWEYENTQFSDYTGFSDFITSDLK